MTSHLSVHAHLVTRTIEPLNSSWLPAPHGAEVAGFRSYSLSPVLWGEGGGEGLATRRVERRSIFERTLPLPLALSPAYRGEGTSGLLCQDQLPLLRHPQAILLPAVQKPDFRLARQ